VLVLWKVQGEFTDLSSDSLNFRFLLASDSRYQGGSTEIEL
jgi:hypothetical protein